MDTILRDIRYAVRGLLRAPGFTTAAVLTLALGIGANTAIFSIVNGIVLRPLPYPKPEQLMYLTTRFPQQGLTQFWVSAPEYMEFRQLTQSFAAVGAYTTGETNVMAGDRPLRVRSASVDEHLFNVLGIQAAHGRLFAPGETDRTVSYLLVVAGMAIGIRVWRNHRSRHSTPQFDVPEEAGLQTLGLSEALR